MCNIYLFAYLFVYLSIFVFDRLPIVLTHIVIHKIKLWFSIIIIIIIIITRLTGIN